MGRIIGPVLFVVVVVDHAHPHVEEVFGVSLKCACFILAHSEVQRILGPWNTPRGDV